jgi:membrane-associated protein
LYHLLKISLPKEVNMYTVKAMLSYIEPTFLIETLGTVGVIAIVFAESGLFFGFFLPGDSLLFTAGLFASQGLIPILPLVLGCVVAAIAGDSVGYAFGRRVGPAIFSKEDSFFFHKKHIVRAENFYKKYGTKTILLARFVPIVRTFAPIVAGVGSMPYKTFLAWNVVGGVLWGAGVTLLGYFLGNTFPQISEYLHWIIIAIIGLSFIPVLIEIYRGYRDHRKQDVV